MDASIFIHSSSFVDPPCEIGEGTKIWHFCHVMAHARLGKRCNLGQNVHVASHVVIGDDVKIQNNVSLYMGCLIEDEVFLGPSCVFTNVIHPRSAISRRHEFQTTKVGRGASIGANATILCGIEIGSYAFVAAGAVVTRAVPAHALMKGVPARHVGWVSEHGCRLAAANAEGVLACPVSGVSYAFDDSGALCRLEGDIVAEQNREAFHHATKKNRHSRGCHGRDRTDRSRAVGKQLDSHSEFLA